MRDANQPEDLARIIRMYGVIRYLPAAQPVMSIWRDGDALLDHLLAPSGKLCSSDLPDTGDYQATLHAIDLLDASLIDIEVASEPGHGSRFTVRLRKA